MATYATSLQCANFAGYKTIGTNTMPTETTVDLWRAKAYGLVRRIIGAASDNAEYDARSAEMEIVAQGFAAVKVGQVPQFILTEDIEDFLQNRFTVENVIDHFEPGQDETN